MSTVFGALQPWEYGTTVGLAMGLSLGLVFHFPGSAFGIAAGAVILSAISFAAALAAAKSQAVSGALIALLVVFSAAGVMGRRKELLHRGRGAFLALVYTAGFTVAAVSVSALIIRASVHSWSNNPVSGVYGALAIALGIGVKAAQLSWNTMAETGRVKGGYDAVGWRLIASTIAIALALVGLALQGFLGLGLPGELPTLSKNRPVQFGWTSGWPVTIAAAIAVLGAALALGRHSREEPVSERPGIAIIAWALAMVGLAVNIAVLLHDLLSYSRPSVLLTAWAAAVSLFVGLMFAEDMLATPIWLQLQPWRVTDWTLAAVSGITGVLSSLWTAESMWGRGQAVPLGSALRVLYVWSGILLAVGASGFVMSRSSPRQIQTTAVSATSAHIVAFASYAFVAGVSVWGTCFILPRLGLPVIPTIPVILTLSAVAGVFWGAFRYWLKDHNNYLRWEESEYVRPAQLARHVDEYGSLEAVHREYIRRLRRHHKNQHWLVGMTLFLSLVGPLAALFLGLEALLKVDWTDESKAEAEEAAT